jgi:hypothetical protein
MPEPDHVVLDPPDLDAELDALLARFGTAAVLRAIRVVVEGRQPSAPDGPPPPPGAVRCSRPLAPERNP